MPISRAAWGVALFKLATADELVSHLSRGGKDYSYVIPARADRSSSGLNRAMRGGQESDSRYPYGGQGAGTKAGTSQQIVDRARRHHRSRTLEL